MLVEYAGPALTSATRYRWRVRIWSEESTEWANGAFETSLLDPGDWVAGWVEPDQHPVVPDGARHFGEIFGGYTAPSPPKERLHPAQYLRQVFELSRRRSAAGSTPPRAVSTRRS